MIRVAVTELEYAKARSIFAACGFACFPVPNREEAVVEAVIRSGASHAIVGVEPYRGPVYQALPAGSVLARFGVGHDGIDKDRATAAGILCTNTPGALDDSVAEHTMALLLAAARRLVSLAADMRKGDWAPVVGSELRGKTLAVIGCGPIGCRVAEIASAGFRMRVIGNKLRPVRAKAVRLRHGFAEVTTDFGAAVREANFVSLHLPANAATRHFLNSERLALIPAGAWVINTARGALVDEAALYAALSAGKLAGAAMDVFENEPYRPVGEQADLRRLDNVILTPHVASSTVEANCRMAEIALANIRLAEAGRYDEMNLLNPGVVEMLRAGGPRAV